MNILRTLRVLDDEMQCAEVNEYWLDQRCFEIVTITGKGQ